MTLRTPRAALTERQNRALTLSTLTLSAATLLLAGALFFKTPPVRTIVMPGTLDEAAAFRFDERGPDARYLELRAVELTELALNLTPETAQSAVARLLAHVDPADYAALEARLRKEAELLAADHASSVFYPMRADADRDALTADVTGVRKLLIGSTVTESKTVTYRASFREGAGRLFLTGLTALDAPDKPEH